MSTVTLSGQQARALAGAQAWIKNPAGKPFYRIDGYAGTGKAQPLTALIQTPAGPVSMGSLQLGQEVLGSSGRATTVTGIYPQGKKPAFRITFRDGAVTECCGEHLWRVVSGNKSTAVKTTQELIDIGLTWAAGDRRWKIPLCEAVQYDSSPAPFDPYTIGVLLGDGYVKGSIVSFVCPDEEIRARVEATLPDGLHIVTNTSAACPRHTIKQDEFSHTHPVMLHLEQQGVAVGSLDKFIPRRYLFAPVEDRVELLRGLMDTDGHCSEGNRTSFSTSSPAMARDVRTLVQSLGGTVITRSCRRQATNTVEYQLNVKLRVCPFHLTRKAANWRVSEKNPPSRYIDSIEPIGEVEQQCITVAAEDHLYLTDEFIVTHNTTIAEQLIEGVEGFVPFATFTGKAASVLARKGVKNVSTIHKLIYKPKDKSQAKLKQLEKERATLAKRDPVPKTLIEKIDAAIAQEIDNLKRPMFSLNTEDSPLMGAALLGIDEYSMLDTFLRDDLLSFKVPMLLLGDPGQLGPVRGTSGFTGEPDQLLTEIHRQAAESPIIKMATEARMGRPLRFGDWGEGCEVVRLSDTDPKLIAQWVMETDQLLVGRNDTRKSSNTRVRELAGRTTWWPQEGDKLVCLRNNHEAGFLNGTTWICTAEAQEVDDQTLYLYLQDDDGTKVECMAHAAYFAGGEPKHYDIKNAECFDYGNALTVHKSQGSQWDDVLIFDEWFSQDRAKWLYTALTRGAKRVRVVHFG